MASQNPGLVPGQNKMQPDEVDISGMAALNPAGSTASEDQPTQVEVENHTSDNTEVHEATENESEAKTQVYGEPKISQREENRVQKLANEKAEAERLRQEAEFRAQQAEALLQRMTNQQPVQPVASEEEQLAKQFRSYDPTVGYPTDGREYAQFVEVRAQARAEAAAREAARREHDEMGMREMLSENPGINEDQILMMAIAAQKAKNPNMSYQQAAREAKKILDERMTKEVTSRVVSDNKAKAEAYVETTRGASSTRQSESAPSPEKMSFSEMEAYLKKIGAWDK